MPTTTIDDLKEIAGYDEMSDTGVDSLIDYKNLLEERLGGSMPTDDTEWLFWTPDSDRNAGWTNHCYVLQHVVTGKGKTPEEAWRAIEFADEVPEGWHRERVTAIRRDHMKQYTPPEPPTWTCRKSYEREEDGVVTGEAECGHVNKAADDECQSCFEERPDDVR
jgi:hypothetical protein